MNINEIKENAKNPRVIKGNKFGDLVKSLVTFPEMMSLRPIVVDNNNVVLGGNMRLKALKYILNNRDKVENIIDEIKEDERREFLLNLWSEFYKTNEVAAVKADELSEEQKREFMIKDNVAFGEWDWDALANEWDSGELTDWGLDTWEAVGSDANEGKEEDLEEDVPIEIDENADADTQPGDIFCADGHILICGDSTKAETYEGAERILGKKIQADMLLTDPPYNVNYTGASGERKPIKNDNINENDFINFLTDAYTNGNEWLKAGAVIYIWMAGMNRIAFFLSFKGMANWHFSQELVWVKSHFVLSWNDYYWQHEICMYGWKGGAAHYFNGSLNKSTILLDEEEALVKNPKAMHKEEAVELCLRLQEERKNINTDVLRAKKPLISEYHPTTKPQELFGKCIRNSSRVGDTVLDIFAGSGTTMIACEKLGRKSICIEMSPHYCDVIRSRYEQNFGVKMERIGNFIA